MGWINNFLHPHGDACSHQNYDALRKASDHNRHVVEEAITAADDGAKSSRCIEHRIKLSQERLFNMEADFLLRKIR